MVPLPGGVSFASRSLSEGLGWVYGEDSEPIEEVKEHYIENHRGITERHRGITWLHKEFEVVWG